MCHLNAQGWRIGTTCGDFSVVVFSDFGLWWPVTTTRKSARLYQSASPASHAKYVLRWVSVKLMHVSDRTLMQIVNVTRELTLYCSI